METCSACRAVAAIIMREGVREMVLVVAISGYNN